MKDVLRLSLPLTLWLIGFSALYGLQGLVCSGDWGAGPEDLASGRIVLLAAVVAAVLVQGGMLFLLGATRAGAAPGLMRSVSLALAAIALIATLWASVPVAVLPLCEG
jgi:hypothetical protein